LDSGQCKTFVNNYAKTSATNCRKRARAREREKRGKERRASWDLCPISLKNEVPCTFFRPIEPIWTVKRCDHVRDVIYPRYFISCRCLYMAIEIYWNEIWEHFGIRWFCHFQDFQICNQIKKEWSMQVISSDITSSYRWYYYYW